MRATVVAVLAADTTLMATLTGGLHSATEISRQNTPAAFDANAEIEPCALVQEEVTTPVGPYDSSERAIFTVTFYERSGFTNIDTAMDRVHTLLHRQKLSGTWEVRHADDSQELEDPALLCPMRYSRYVAYRTR